MNGAKPGSIHKDAAFPEGLAGHEGPFCVAKPPRLVKLMTFVVKARRVAGLMKHITLSP